MAISLDTFRNLAATGNIALGQDGASLREATFGDKIKLFFGFGDARAKNASVLNDFKNALCGDSRYFALHEKINTLVNEIRTDRAIGAAKIRSILTELDHDSTLGKQSQAFMERVSLHLSARGTPEALKSLPPQQYLGRLTEFMHNRTKTPFGEINISMGIEDFNRQMLGHLASIGEDADLRELFFAANRSIIRTEDAKIRTPEKVEQRLADMRTTLNEARACIGTYGADLMDDVKTMLISCKKFPEGRLPTLLSGACAKLHDLMKGVDFSNPKTVAVQVHEVIKNFCVYAGQESAKIARGDPEVGTGCNTLLLNTALKSLDAETRTGLAQFLTGETGVQLRQLYHRPPSGNLVRTLDTMRDFTAQAVAAARIPDVTRELDEPPANPGALGLSRSDLFDLMPSALTSEARAAEVCLRKQNAILDGLPAFSSTPEAKAYGRAMLEAMDKVFGAPLVSAPGETVKAGQIDGAHVDFIKSILMQELAEMPAEARPAPKDLPAFLENHPLVQLDKSPADGTSGPLLYTTMSYRLRQMNAAQRAACLDMLKAFGHGACGSDGLMRSFGEHVDELTALHSAGKLTWERAYEKMTGTPVPSEKIAAGATPMKLWTEYEHRGVQLADQLFAKGQITPDQYTMMAFLTTDAGLEPDVALKVVRGEIPKPADKDPFKPEVMTGLGYGTENAEADLAKDLYRFTVDYSVDGKPAGVPPGATYVFKAKAGSERPDGMISTEAWVKEARHGLDEFNRGVPSPLSKRMKNEVLGLCRGNTAQASLVLLALGQGATARIRNLAALHGVVANEHSPAVWTLERRENGDVAVTVSQPEKCPLEFKWTFVFGPDGRQSMEGEPIMRRAS